MSNYIKTTKHPITNKWEEAEWLDNLLGKHHYGVVFPSDRNKYPKNIDVPTLQMIAFDPEKIDLRIKERK